MGQVVTAVVEPGARYAGRGSRHRCRGTWRPGDRLRRIAAIFEDEVPCREAV